MQHRHPRLTSVMGVARALVSTVGAEDAVNVLVLEFGWDVTFQALALLRGEDAGAAFGIAWQRLLIEPFDHELRGLPGRPEA